MTEYAANRFFSLHFYFLSLYIAGADGAYFPNFGFVGCYIYTNNMERYCHFTEFKAQLPHKESFAANECTQHCLHQKMRYAGLMNKFDCFCGNDYNQTFAVDERRCMCYNSFICADYMKIYNTDYDVKPLLSLPGNQSNIMKAWRKTGSFDRMFVGDVMRNPAIDWWNERRLYHKPEFVKLVTLNKYGQWLWSMDFFSNESTAKLTEWMTAKNVLKSESMNPQLSEVSISLSEDAIAIHNAGQAVWFLNGDIQKDGSRVTVFTHNQDPQTALSYNSTQWCLENLMQCTGDECETQCEAAGFVCRTDDQPDQCHCHCITGYQQDLCNNSLHQLRPAWEDSQPHCSKANFSDESSCRENCSEFQFMVYYDDGICICLEKAGQFNDCNITFQIRLKPNYGPSRLKDLYNKTLENKTESIVTFTDFEYVCGIHVELDKGNSLMSQDTYTYQLTVWTTGDLTEVMDITVNPGTIYHLDACIYSNRMELHIFGLEIPFSIQYFIYTIDDPLIIADRVVFLGYYHKEEPKVSKWEFLNNYTIEEIQNIMRPRLEKTQSEGSVAVRNLSSSVRKKESATDSRESSQGIGILGGSLLGFVFILIFISDIFVMKVHLTAMYRNLYSAFNNIKTNRPKDG